jgi:hypothetical protein
LKCGSLNLLEPSEPVTTVYQLRCCSVAKYRCLYLRDNILHLLCHSSKTQNYSCTKHFLAFARNVSNILNSCVTTFYTIYKLMYPFLLLVSLNTKCTEITWPYIQSRSVLPVSASPYSYLRHLPFVFPFSVLYARLRLRPKWFLEYCKEY